MRTNLDRYKKDLEKLIDKGQALLSAMFAEHSPEAFDRLTKSDGRDVKDVRAKLPMVMMEYQPWYSESLVIIRQLLPDRINDFEAHYKKPKTRKELSYESYRIEDCLQGLTATRGALKEKVVGPDAALPHMQQQLAILKSVESRFESSLFDIKQLVQADLFDSELEAASELAKKGFLRGAGAIAGVVIEKHLAQVVSNHKLTLRKAHPTINDFNELLKNENVLDIPGWRNVQRLADLRNLCDHNKNREPTKEEIQELIVGVEKLTKTLF